MRIGIFSGTFDPIHRGHVAFALAAAKQLKLDKVLVMPERVPRAKPTVSDFSHRLHMVRLATKPHRKLKTLALPDEKFTIDTTMAQLQQLYPDAEWFMLLGSDLVRTFSFRWPGLARLLQQVDLAISLRAGESEADIREFLASLNLPLNAHVVAGPHAHLSATQVRQGYWQGIEPAVRAYIEQNQLYASADAA